MAMVVWKTGPRLQNVGFFDVQKPAKYDDFVIYVLAQVTWLWCQTTTESTKKVGVWNLGKVWQNTMCQSRRSSDGPVRQLNRNGIGPSEKTVDFGDSNRAEF